MPPVDAGGPFTQEQKDMIALWISQGALNNSCTPDCDPTAFTFSATILPVIDNYCTGCHSCWNPDGGVAFVTYADIIASALDGRLMTSLLGTNNFPSVPVNCNSLFTWKLDQDQARIY